MFHATSCSPFCWLRGQDQDELCGADGGEQYSDALGVGNRLEHWPEAVRPAHSLDATSCRTQFEVYPKLIGHDLTSSKTPLVEGTRGVALLGARLALS